MSNIQNNFDDKRNGMGKKENLYGDSIKDRITSVATVASCKLGKHAWDGCKCIHCGKTRDEGHNFQLMEGVCQRQCLVCGKTEAVPHKWEGRICAVCGKTRFAQYKVPLMSGIALLVILVLLGIMGIFENGDNKNAEGQTSNTITVPAASDELKYNNYEDVLTQFESAGFTDIKTEAIEDLILGLLTKDGEVEKVSIDGEENFKAGSKFKYNAKIIVYYHTFSQSDMEDGEGVETTKDSESQQIFNGAIGRLAVDVYKELKDLDYTVSFSHDVTGMDFTGDVKYIASGDDPEYYIEWLIVRKDEYNNKSKTASFFIDTQERIDESLQKDTILKSLTKKLSPSCAWGAVEMYGKKQFPYGFKLNLVKGMLAERAKDENTWFLKAYCEVTYEYGTKLKFSVCEANVTGTSESPKVVYFNVYN